jgi:CTP:molybdopterin cytidylyltransferase MocA
MTVAAIVLVPDAAAALADADGEPAIRRVVHAAWSGGALPIVIVASDPAGIIAAAVSDLPVKLAGPAAGPPGIAWFSIGLVAAVAGVSETTAGLLWPFRYAWVDPETVTSLVEAHGAAPDAIAEPSYGGQIGFPVLVPISFIARLEAQSGRSGAEAVAAILADGAPGLVVELGDPGIVSDITTPHGNLPGYQGPSGPAGGPAPDWNAEVAAAAQVPDQSRPTA